MGLVDDAVNDMSPKVFGVTVLEDEELVVDGVVGQSEWTVRVSPS